MSQGGAGIRSPGHGCQDTTSRPLPRMRKNPLAELLGALHARGSRDPASGGALARIGITIRHRGAPGDRVRLTLEQIAGVGSRALRLEDGTVIPFHRVLAIERDGETLWARPERAAAQAEPRRPGR